MARTIALAQHVEEIPLADPARGGLLQRMRRKARRDASSPRLLLTDRWVALAGGATAKRIEIPWGELRKAVVDDGGSWGYVSGVCRFPVYDLRADGSGSGVLIGPLWSHASSLMPPGCPVEAVEPVPGQAPNLLLMVEPGSAVLVRVLEPESAREALAARDKLGDLDHDDLQYLASAAGDPRQRRLAPGAGPSAATA